MITSAVPHIAARPVAVPFARDADPPAGTAATPPQRPSAAEEQAARAAGLDATRRYVALARQAGGRDALSFALTGRKVSNLEPGARARMIDFLDRLARGQVAMPVFTSAATGGAADVRQGNPGLGPEVLPTGVRGAFVESRQLALLSRALRGEDLHAAAREEAGEALAAAARRAGVGVKAGDAGARLLAAVTGKPVPPSSFVADPSTDATRVNVGGKELEASAQVLGPFVDARPIVRFNAADQLQVQAQLITGRWVTIADNAGSGARYPRSLGRDIYLFKDGFPVVRLVNLTDKRKGKPRVIPVNRLTSTASIQGGTKIISMEDRPGKSNDKSNVRIELRRVAQYVDNAITQTKIAVPSEGGGPPDRLSVTFADLDAVPKDTKRMRSLVQAELAKIPPVYNQTPAAAGRAWNDSLAKLNVTLTEKAVRDAQTLVAAGAPAPVAARIAAKLSAWATAALVVAARVHILKHDLVALAPRPDLGPELMSLSPENQKRVALYTGAIAVGYTAASALGTYLGSLSPLSKRAEIGKGVLKVLNGASAAVALGGFAGLGLSAGTEAALQRLRTITKGAFQFGDFTLGVHKAIDASEQKIPLGQRIANLFEAGGLIAGAVGTATPMVMRTQDWSQATKKTLDYASTFGLGFTLVAGPIGAALEQWRG